jgi:hypothetical protein
MEEIYGFWEWVKLNKEWVFGGIGIPALLFILEKFTGMFTYLIKEIWVFLKKTASPVPATPVLAQQNIVCAHTPEERKRLTKILFIDDKTDFPVVNILKNSGWKNTRIIKRVTGVDDRNILDADICFVDINGVAKNLFPKDQGLGLVAAIRERHPNKRVVVYSSQTKRDAFDPLWEMAHARLPKNADPYEFENLVEIYSAEIYC